MTFETSTSKTVQTEKESPGPEVELELSFKKWQRLGHIHIFKISIASTSILHYGERKNKPSANSEIMHLFLVAVHVWSCPKMHLTQRIEVNVTPTEVDEMTKGRDTFVTYLPFVQPSSSPICLPFRPPFQLWMLMFGLVRAGYDLGGQLREICIRNDLTLPYLRKYFCIWGWKIWK